METVTVSSKYQVVIPRSVRERLGIKPGQRVQVIPYGNRIEILPIEDPRQLRGLLAGEVNDLAREPDRP